MRMYTHVLAAVDLSDESKNLLEKAVALAQANEAKLSLIHVVEPLHAYGTFMALDYSEIHARALQHADKALKALAESVKMPVENCIVADGVPQELIHQVVADEGVDLVVIGSHGRKGISLLLGSTANAVLHGSTCDVLAIRIK